MSLTNYTPPFGILELGHTYLTEFALEIQQIQSVDPLLEFLPQRAVQEKDVRVEWTEEELRLMGVVKPGMPNKLNTFAKAKEFTFKPAHFRRGDFIDMEIINHLRAPGQMQKEYGMDLVQNRLMNLIDQANLMMAMLRAQLMSGGINYQDQESGISIVANSGIPGNNMYTIGAGAMAASTKWHDVVNAKIVDDIQRLVYMMTLEGKNAPTHAIVSAAMLEMISRNAQVRQFLVGNLSGLASTGLVTWGADGKVESIAGVKFVVHKMLMDDLVAGNLTRQFMWPVNKIAFFSARHPSLPTQRLGYSVVTRGEHPNGLQGGTGIYVRTGEVREDNLLDPTLPPGLTMQVGMAGLPVLYKPWWVHLVTCCDKADLTGVLGSKYIV